jgi:hypothetical protein
MQNAKELDQWLKSPRNWYTFVSFEGYQRVVGFDQIVIYWNIEDSAGHNQESWQEAFESPSCAILSHNVDQRELASI